MKQEILPVQVDTEAALANYSPTDAAIAEMSARFMPLRVESVKDRDGLQKVHEARMVVKGHRVAIEKTRKFLKADALEYGRKVDAEAKRLTALLSPIEEHLQEQESIVEREKERLRQEAEEARLRKLRGRMERLAAVRSPAIAQDIESLSDEEFAAVLAGATEEDDRRRREEAAAEEERKAEAQRLAAERAKLEAEQAKQQEAEERLAAERADIEAERRKVEEARRHQEEQERIRAAEEAAAAKAKEEARLDEERRKEADRLRKIAEEAEAARLEALRPEIEKVRAFAKQVRAIAIPQVSCASRLGSILTEAADKIDALANSEERPQ